MVLPSSLKGIIYRLSGNSVSWELNGIEKMSEDVEPSVIWTGDADSDLCNDLLEEIKLTKVRFIREEVGMEISSDLYTMFIVSDEGVISITANDKGMLHINQTNRTYAIVIRDSTKLYNCMKLIYESAGTS